MPGSTTAKHPLHSHVWPYECLCGQRKAQVRSRTAYRQPDTFRQRSCQDRRLPAGAVYSLRLTEAKMGSGTMAPGAREQRSWKLYTTGRTARTGSMPVRQQLQGDHGPWPVVFEAQTCPSQQSWRQGPECRISDDWAGTWKGPKQQPQRPFSPTPSTPKETMFRQRPVKGGGKTYHWGGAKLYHRGDA